MLTFNCKGDGSNPEDLDDCSIWQSVIYALKEGAEADVLPKAEEPAAQAILLPDLVTALDGYDFGRRNLKSRFSGKHSAFRDVHQTRNSRHPVGTGCM